jgi:protein-disulfide isomerase
MIPRLFRAFAIFLLACSAMAATALADAVTPAQKKAFEQIIHDYLVNNPDVVVEALKSAKARDDARAADQARELVTQNQDALIHDPDSPVGGNPNGDVTMVEFFDYSCPYCKQVEPSLEAMQVADPKLRVVYKEFPILGPASIVASRVALAARKQGKYDAFHRAMINTKGQLNDDVIIKVAQSVGLDVDKIKVDMATPDVEKVLRSDFELAKALHVQATPVFVIGDTILAGAADMDTLHRLIADARAHE